MKIWCIYALSDPRTPDDVRYVGKTSSTIKKRVSEHFTHAQRSASKTHLVNWLLKLLLEGLSPYSAVLEQGDGDWEIAECKWIAWHRERGYDLCNATNGGEGASPGHVKSLETRARLSAANRGKTRSVEARARMSAARKGRGPVLTPESYVKMSKTKTGRPGPKQSVERIARRVALIKIAWNLKKAEGWKPTPCSHEGRLRTTAANKGRKNSPETLAKMRAAKKGQGLGRKLCPETRAKMSESQKVRQAAIRKQKADDIVRNEFSEDLLCENGKNHDSQ